MRLDLQTLPHFSEVWATRAAGHRLERARTAAVRLRDVLLHDAPVPYFEAFPLVRVPYPVRYAFRDAIRTPAPLLQILNRMFVVQFRREGRLCTLLVSPSDARANAATPFFARLAESFGPFRELGTRAVAPEIDTVEGCLARIGLAPEAIDFITFDHLHTQDLRKWLGTANRPAYFPRAKLLVHRTEWEQTQALTPLQRDWYCPDGVLGISDDRVVQFEDSVRLGEGVALVYTPGHTEGNHSIVVRTPEGLAVTSENGVCADSYAPLASKLPGLAEHARVTGREVILNGNTLERSTDQYISMVVEKTLAGPCPQAPEFPNVLVSSEVRPFWGAPGIVPTLMREAVRHGALVVADSLPGGRE
jgi:hypothetical protein